MPIAHHADRHVVGDPSTATLSDAQARTGLLVICAAAFFMSADVTITNIALPAIAADLGASMSELQWIVDSYNITLAGLLLLGAGLGERFGRKGAFLTGVTLFMIGSAVAGLAPSVTVLIGARVAMGVGGALLLAPALSLIAVLFPPARRGKAIASWAAAGGLGLAIAPVLAGAVLTVASWNWLFLMNVPVMLLAVLIGVRALPSGAASSPVRLDVVGAALSVVGFVLFLGGLIEAPRAGWTSPLIITAILGGALVIAGFVMWELHRSNPMIEVRVLTRRGVVAASITLFLSYVSFTGSVFLASQQLQVVIGVSDMVLGLCLAPAALSFWLVSARAARISERFGAARTLLWGLGFMCAGFVIAALTAPLTSPITIVVMLCVASLGWGLVIPVGSVVIINDLPAKWTSSGSGTSMLSRFLGASFGIAILGTVIATITGTGQAHQDAALLNEGLTWAYASGAVMTVIGLVAAIPLLHGWRPGSAPADDADAAAASAG